MTISFTDLQTWIEDIIKLHYKFSGANVSSGDPQVYDRGITHAAILWPGGIQNRVLQSSPRVMSENHSIQIELSVRESGNSKATNDAFVNLRDEFIAHVDKYPTLNGKANVSHAMISRVGEVIRWAREENWWWSTIITLDVIIRQHVDIAE